MRARARSPKTEIRYLRRLLSNARDILRWLDEELRPKRRRPVARDEGGGR